MSLLVLNCGSSSVKAAIFNDKSLEQLLDLRVTGISEEVSQLHVGKKVKAFSCPNHSTAIQLIFTSLSEADHELSKVTVIGHRVLHGADQLVQPTLITDDVERIIESMSSLVPLHNAACLAGIRGARHLLPNCPQVAVFDTAFHATLPLRARLYALPENIPSTHPIRRYGFHGISHDFVSQATANSMGRDRRHLRIISCHLGNGCSVAAIENGRSVETSMGMTPLEGLVMGTRSGDVDPGVVLHLMRNSGSSVDELDALLNRKSGLLGMTGTNDMAQIETRAAAGDESCRRAIHVFTHRVRKYIGAYAVTMGGVDAIVFTGGIGENSTSVRHRIAQRLGFLGAILDEDRNREAGIRKSRHTCEISTATSRVKLMVVETNEEAAIARQVTKRMQQAQTCRTPCTIPVAVSTRHVHLTELTIAVLYGPDYQLTQDYALSQPGQFAAKETVTLVGPLNKIGDVRILGPVRNKDQVEISRTDEFFLGIDAPIRASGDIDNTPGITLVGPAGTVTLVCGVICALRHIHMHPRDAAEFQLISGDRVNVTVDDDSRTPVFSDVLVRVGEQYRLEMHIDTDEADAAGLQACDDRVLSNVGSCVTIVN